MAFVIEGAKELSVTLRMLSDGIAVRAVVKKSLRIAAAPVLESARGFAPFLSGDLRRSLKIRVGPRSRVRTSVVIRAGDRASLGIPANAKGYYPTHQELGARGGKLPATRYLRRAMDINRIGSIAILSRELGRGIEGIAARGAINVRGGRLAA